MLPLCMPVDQNTNGNQDQPGQMSGRCLEAVDDILNLPLKIPEIMASEAFTLRRLVME